MFSTYFVVKKKNVVSSWDVPQEGQTYRPKRMVLCRAMPWMAATWEAYWSDQGIIFQKTKKHSIPPFYHVVYDVFLHVLLGKMTLGHESRCSKITISWPVLGAWVWKFLPCLARRSLEFGAILPVWAAFSRVNLRFFRFVQPATSPKSTANPYFSQLVPRFFCPGFHAILRRISPRGAGSSTCGRSAGWHWAQKGRPPRRNWVEISSRCTLWYPLVI